MRSNVDGHIYLDIGVLVADSDVCNIGVHAAVVGAAEDHRSVDSPVSAPAVFDQPVSICCVAVEQNCVVQVIGVRRAPVVHS